MHLAAGRLKCKLNAQPCAKPRPRCGRGQGRQGWPRRGVDRAGMLTPSLFATSPVSPGLRNPSFALAIAMHTQKGCSSPLKGHRPCDLKCISPSFAASKSAVSDACDALALERAASAAHSSANTTARSAAARPTHSRAHPAQARRKHGSPSPAPFAAAAARCVLRQQGNRRGRPLQTPAPPQVPNSPCTLSLLLRLLQAWPPGRARARCWPQRSRPLKVSQCCKLQQGSSESMGAISVQSCMMCLCMRGVRTGPLLHPQCGAAVTFVVVGMLAGAAEESPQ